MVAPARVSCTISDLAGQRPTCLRHQTALPSDADAIIFNPSFKIDLEALTSLSWPSPPDALMYTIEGFGCPHPASASNLPAAQTAAGLPDGINALPEELRRLDSLSIRQCEEGPEPKVHADFSSSVPGFKRGDVTVDYDMEEKLSKWIPLHCDGVDPCSLKDTAITVPVSERGIADSDLRPRQKAVACPASE